ncbi:MAG: 30S ribosomal protein S11, partial [Acidobacteria bacterium]|nr:30S ribosomal protein S11 [Acidobacteriota bacterium]
MAKEKKSAKKRSTKKKEKITVVHGIACIKATFNNTVITITDLEGNVLTSCSAGARGF